MKLIYLFFFFFLSLLNFQKLFNSNLFTYFFTLIQLAIFAYYLFNRQLYIFSYLKKNTTILLVALLSVYAISILRANEFSLLLLMSYTGFCLFLLAYTSQVVQDIKDGEIEASTSFLNYYIMPFVLYCGANLLFWMLNIKSNGDEGETVIGQSMILATYGVYINRVNFIFANGINSFAVVMGAVFTYTLSHMLIYRQFNFKLIVSNVIILISLLLTDSRSSIFYPLLIALLGFLLYYTKRYSIIKWTTFLFFLAPFLLAYLLPYIAELPFLQQYSRSSTDLVTLNGRLFIWFFALDEFIQFKLQHLIGYGFMGHESSGASLKWAFLFPSYKNPEVVHPHNSIISLLFDVGYIGILLLLIVFRKISKILIALWHRNQQHCMILFAFLVYIILISVTESFICLYYLNAINLFFALVVYLFAIDSLYEEADNPADPS